LSLEDDLIRQRLERAHQIQALGFKPYGHRFEASHTIPEIVAQFTPKTGEELEAVKIPVTIAGRIQTLRRMGKAGFAHLMQGAEKLQIYIKKDAVSGQDYQLYNLFDLGDQIGCGGYLFRTRTGELSVHVEKLYFLSKAILPMPEKWHGLEDVETRYRQRYLDMIANPEVQKTFLTRAKIIGAFRKELEARNFVEVETPMMQPLYGGAAANPFVTHHNTLDMDLYLRIAPELYLKRLVAGGLDRVYEINKNFRNEGISAKHNPEFTMLEFYQAYTDYKGLMDLSAELLKAVAIAANQSTKVMRDGREIDFANIRRLTMREAVLEYWKAGDKPSLDNIRDPEWLMSKVPGKHTSGERLVDLFERYAEPELFDPTFIYEYPVEVSPLSKNNDDDPAFVDRFEIYCANMEIGNAYTELNDPQEQRRRFEMQLGMRERGDDEAHQMDEDFIRALCYGMPPTAGEGIGIDRLTMILTGSKSIRDVILFPLLRREGDIGLAEKLRAFDGIK
jgi:lysyl-tRNA synthetase, class II